MRRRLLVLALVFAGSLLAPADPLTAGPGGCSECEHVFNSYFCWPAFPGRENCVTTITYCAMSGAFCDLIIVDG